MNIIYNYKNSHIGHAFAMFLCNLYALLLLVAAALLGADGASGLGGRDAQLRLVLLAEKMQSKKALQVALELDTCLVREVWEVSRKMVRADDLDTLFYERKCYQTMGAARNFLDTLLGWQVIEILFHGPQCTLERQLFRKIYRDESHPVDLVRLLKSRRSAEKIGNLIFNTKNILSDYNLPSRLFGTNRDYNRFLERVLRAKPALPCLGFNVSPVLDLSTEPKDREKVREVMRRTLQSLGVSSEIMDEHLSLSSKRTRGGIYLHRRQNSDLKDTQSVALAVADLNGRTVTVSQAGYAAIESLAEHYQSILGGLKERIRTEFSKKDFVVSGRCKNARGILDKLGRRAAKTQKSMDSKGESILDLVDILGIRVISESFDAIPSIIQQIQKAGFQMLEIDNKYLTIRKNGAYKVIPCTVFDPTTDSIFELQLCTFAGAIWMDLAHQTLYKSEAVGLSLSQEECDFVAAGERLCALIDTLRLFGNSIPTSRKFSPEDEQAVAELISHFYLVVEHQKAYRKPVRRNYCRLYP